MERARKKAGLKKTVAGIAVGLGFVGTVAATNADKIKQTFNFKDRQQTKIEQATKTNPHENVVIPIEKANKTNDLADNFEGRPDTGYVAVLEDIYNNFSSDLDNLSTNVKGLVNQAHNWAQLMRDDPNSANGNMKTYVQKFLLAFSTMYDPHYVYTAKDRDALYRMADKLAPYVKEFGLENTHEGLLVTNEVYRNNWQHILDLDNQGASSVLDKKLRNDQELSDNDVKVYKLSAYQVWLTSSNVSLEKKRATVALIDKEHDDIYWKNASDQEVKDAFNKLMNEAKTLMLDPSTAHLPMPVIKEKSVSNGNAF